MWWLTLKLFTIFYLVPAVVCGGGSFLAVRVARSNGLKAFLWIVSFGTLLVLVEVMGMRPPAHEYVPVMVKPLLVVILPIATHLGLRHVYGPPVRWRALL